MEENKIDKIIQINIEEEMKTSYINYAMSVIASRALPDVRDGLKPVHRRILYAMDELNLDPSKPYRKSARIVGDTMGKYHPHGDSSIYEAMVRMAQDFSTRYQLVDGHGNFGSIDGDSAAAMRYTEARLSKISMEMLADIEKNTVDFIKNFDETMEEPTVMPARFPNLLVNGSSGIAVGMATNIPPHNLNEVIEAVVKIIDNHVLEDRETDIEELIQIVKGPDFPTGASILGTSGIKAAYRTGKGKVKVRAVAEIVPMQSGREMIVVTQIPYQVNKARLVEKIAGLVRDKKVDSIYDLRDESDRNGMRIVIELKKDANANVTLNQLYKFTQLQESYGMNMLALYKNEPCVLNLKQMLVFYLEHQKDVVTRRTKFDLEKAQRRAHILEGLMMALDHIDEAIQIIRSSRDTAIAKTRLIERFALSDEQSQAIVDMRLRALTGLERDKLENEYKELQVLINELLAILGDEKRLYAVIREELTIVQAKFGDQRRTEIMHDVSEINMEDLIDEEVNVITMTHLNYIKRLPLNTYRIQNRGGKGVVGMQTREEDFVKKLFLSSTHNFILFFTNLGRAYKLKAYEIPESGRTSRGVAIVNLLELSQGEFVTAVIPVKDFSDGFLFMATKKGVVKRTPLVGFSKIRKGGITAINLNGEDQLISVKLTKGGDKILMATRCGLGIKFDENDVRSVGRNAAGVRGVRLNKDDFVVSAEIAEDEKKALIVSENGYGKLTKNDIFNLQSRGGKGVKIYKITEKTSTVVGVEIVSDNDEIMLITSEGSIIRIRAKEVSTMGRITQGVRLMNVSEDVNVVSIAKIAEEDLQDEEMDSGVIADEEIEKMIDRE